MPEEHDFKALLAEKQEQADAWLADQTYESLMALNAPENELISGSWTQMRLYPITILPARYGGAYEGGHWLAFGCYEHLIPAAAFGSDVPCAAWWNKNAKYVGIGNTIKEAVVRLALIKRDTDFYTWKEPPAWEPLDVQQSELWAFYNQDGTMKTWDQLPTWLVAMIEAGLQEVPEGFVIPLNEDVAAEDE